jgi:hypothetical protein
MTTRRTLQPQKDRPELDRLLKESAATFDAMAPDKQEAMLREQQKSFARQDKD